MSRNNPQPSAKSYRVSLRAASITDKQQWFLGKSRRPRPAVLRLTTRIAMVQPCNARSEHDCCAILRIRMWSLHSGPARHKNSGPGRCSHCQVLTVPIRPSQEGRPNSDVESVGPRGSSRLKKKVLHATRYVLLRLATACMAPSESDSRPYPDQEVLSEYGH